MIDNQIETKMRSRKVLVEQNSEKIQRIVDTLVAKYNHELDEYMDEVKTMLDNAKEKGSEVSTMEIEDITLRIPLYMYYAANGLEDLGVQGDNAKAIKMEIYNSCYLEAEGTISDKQHTAEQETFTEYLLEIAFTRAYKKLKTKIDIAEQMCQASRKVLQKRITEMDVFKIQSNYQQGERNKNFD